VRGLRTAVLLVFVAALAWVPTAGAMVFSPALGSPFAVGHGPESVAVGDFNGDGHPDLAVANGEEKSVSVLLGNGNGGFSPAIGSPFAVGSYPRSVAVADFNGDGHPDLAVAANSGESGSVSVLLGDGSGGFSNAPGSPWSAGVSPSSVAVGDFNGDGHPDLAVANWSESGSVSVLLGNGSGGFSPASGSPFAVGRYSRSVVVADFNGDGHPDLATASASDNNVSVLLGNGSGGFSPAIGSPFTVGRDPESMAVGDFNGDGHPDLATANLVGYSVSVLLGNGSGGFSAASGSPFRVGSLPTSLAVGDFNGDGHPDLATVNRNENSVSVLLGNGSGGFSPASGSPFTVGNNPYSVAVGDFNGDGYPDLAVANREFSTVSVLLNIPPHTSITSGPSGTTRQTTATFSLSSDQSSSTFECRLDAGSWAGCASPMTYSALTAGAHSFDVRAINDAGVTDLIGATSSWNVDLSTPPSAALAVSPNPVLAGQPVTLDASASHDPLDGTIVDYKWDLSGNGSFERDTGTNPTTSWSYAVPGIAHPRVRVTNEVGTTAITTVELDVRPATLPGEVGVSINNGDYATNTTAVQVYVVWPAFASNALVSNDGGFNTAGGTTTTALTPTIPWTLRSEGSERLPKIVYVRFPGSLDPTQTFTDDIILDTTTPVVQSASSTGSATTASVASAHRHKGRVFRVRLHATEKLSGISAAQFSTRPSGGITVTFTDRAHQGIQRLARVVKVAMAKRPRYVRVRSAAGNWSKWHRIGG
jgi:FG-GAP-like repeat/PKD domain/FG-GAP repeat